MRRIAPLVLLGLLLTAPGVARGNGRYPAAQALVAAPDGQTLVLRATFGLLVSRDAGASWSWLCEEAVGFAGVWDPPVAPAQGPAWFVGLPDGLARSADLCQWSREPAAESLAVADLAWTPEGALVVGVAGNAAAPNPVLSSARGAAASAVGTIDASILPATVEVAPSLPTRLYVSGLADTGGARSPVLLRSDDGGQHFAPAGAALSAYADAWVAAVDPSNPDGLWLRCGVGAGTALLRSADGGRTAREVARTSAPMLGFALDSTGQRVWYGSAEEGLFSSADGGRTFANVAPTHLTCLRYAAGALYVCADWLREPFALARWRDGAAGLEPVLAFDQVQGPLSCGSGSTTTAQCAPRWPVVRDSLLRRSTDAGLRDASVDALPPLDALLLDASPLDAAPGSEPAAPARGCACAAPGATPSGSLSRALLVGMAVAAALSLRRRERPSRR